MYSYDNTIKDNTAYSTPAGYALMSSRHLTITGNRTTDSEDYGFLLNFITQSTFSHNHIKNVWTKPEKKVLGRDGRGYLDPENKRNVSQILVHDMSKVPWGSNSIDDKHFSDAKAAWFVTGSEKTGAMGKTLARFSLESDAQAFTAEFGGKVLSFKAVNQDSLW